jgi:hypothetical protein
MTRFVRNTVILAKEEVTVGTDPTPTGGSNAMLVSNLTINPLNAQNVSRDLVRGFKGGSEQLVGTRFVECGFDIELVGSGTVGTAPAWGALMKACGWSELATADVRVDYTLVSTGEKSVTIYWYDDGVLHKLLGARGNVMIKLNSGGRPVLSFSFKGLDGGISAVSNATPTLTAFKTPLVVTEANTANLTFGATHDDESDPPALVTGTAYPSLGMEFNLGNRVEHIPLLGGESVEIVDRDASCTFQLELTAAQEVTFMANVKSAALTSVGLIHGTVDGYKSLLFLPFVQQINPAKQEQAGKRMNGYEGRVVPSLGNDEARLVLF